jgi:hypothetical protein
MTTLAGTDQNSEVRGQKSAVNGGAQHRANTLKTLRRHSTLREDLLLLNQRIAATQRIINQLRTAQAVSAKAQQTLEALAEELSVERAKILADVQSQFRQQPIEEQAIPLDGILDEVHDIPEEMARPIIRHGLEDLTFDTTATAENPLPESAAEAMASTDTESDAADYCQHNLMLGKFL